MVQARKLEESTAEDDCPPVLPVAGQLSRLPCSSPCLLAYETPLGDIISPQLCAPLTCSVSTFEENHVASPGAMPGSARHALPPAFWLTDDLY